VTGRAIGRIPAAALLSLALLGQAFPGAATAAGPGPKGTGLVESYGDLKVGQAAPPIRGEDPDGRPVTPEAFEGRPVLIDFGSIFCPSCQETIREFRRLQDVYRGTDLALVVVVDGETPPKALKNYFRQTGATHAVLRDPDNGLFRRYGIDVIPFQVAIGRDGKIRKIHAGFAADVERVMGLRELVGK
jgi:peroxiredoxin